MPDLLTQLHASKKEEEKETRVGHTQYDPPSAGPLATASTIKLVSTADRVREIRETAQKLAQHDLIKALANFDHIVMGRETRLRAYNELTPKEIEGYGWMVATIRRVVWGE